MDASQLTELLSRWQFGFTASYHIIFPATSIGLAWFLVIIHWLYLRTHKDVYFRLYKFWVSIFALTFTVGVVTGIFMSFQFGLNWSGYAHAAGPILGIIIGLEVLTAFFLEAGFLGIMLLGWNRVSEKVHFFATLMVALGTLISATWILGANSWMHTPAGFSIEGDQFFISNFWEALINPSFIVRYPHMILAALITASLLVVGISAYYVLKKRYVKVAKRGMSIALGILTIAIFTQIWLGDVLALKMVEYQPGKVAAFEGWWDDEQSAAWLVYIDPDQENERNNAQWGIPYLGSWLITKDFNGVLPGIKNIPKGERPPVGFIFYTFRVMFLLGVTMFILAAISIFLRLTNRLFTTKWFLKFCLIMTPAGALATVAGWLTSEIGRQPYVIFGQLRTDDAISPLNSGEVIFSLSVFGIIYIGILLAYIYFIVKLVKKGPEEPLMENDDNSSIGSAQIHNSL